MTRTLVTIGVIFVLSGSNLSNVDAQNIYGPGGLLLNPTALSQPKGHLTVSILARRQDMSNMMPGMPYHTHSLGIVGLNYGLGSRTEAGINFMGIGGDMGKPPTYGGFLKHVIVKENNMKPAIALGVVSMPVSHWRTQFGFLAATKTLATTESGHPIHAHVGVIAPTSLAGVRTTDLSPYAGMDIGLSPQLTFFLEGRSKTSADASMASAVGISYKFGQDSTLSIGLANEGAGDKHLFNIGIGYNFTTLD